MSSSTNLTSSTINTDTTNYSVAEGQELVAQGKRHLLVSSVPEAVSTLALACSVLARHHGETSELCAEAYFHYGRALLEMSRIESTVLGNALEGVNMDEEKEEKKSDIVENTEGMTMDERGEIEEKVAEALEENFEKHDKIASIHLAEVEESEEDSSVDEDKMETGEEKMETEEAKSQEKMDTDKVEAEHTETDPGNLEQAWEMFELCKVIWGKAGNVARECEALICLGEVSMENENYAQAVEDIVACLAKRVQALPRDSRSAKGPCLDPAITLAPTGRSRRPTTSWAWPRPTPATTSRPAPASRPPWPCCAPGSRPSARWKSPRTLAGRKRT